MIAEDVEKHAVGIIGQLVAAAIQIDQDGRAILIAAHMRHQITAVGRAAVDGRCARMRRRRACLRALRFGVSITTVARCARALLIRDACVDGLAAWRVLIRAINHIRHRLERFSICDLRGELDVRAGGNRLTVLSR